MAEVEELVERLVRQKEALEGILLRLNTAIEYLRHAKEALGPDDLAKLLETLSQSQPTQIQSPPKEPQRVRGVLSPDDIAAAVRAVLLEVGRPMKRGALVKELEKRQIPLAGTDKNKNLGTILWRNADKFINLDKLGYWLKDVAIRDVYEPTK